MPFSPSLLQLELPEDDRQPMDEVGGGWGPVERLRTRCSNATSVARGALEIPPRMSGGIRRTQFHAGLAILVIGIRATPPLRRCCVPRGR